MIEIRILLRKLLNPSRSHTHTHTHGMVIEGFTFLCNQRTLPSLPLASHLTQSRDDIAFFENRSAGRNFNYRKVTIV